jgi:tetratricopeptide (TPR) repeat protein
MDQAIHYADRLPKRDALLFQGWAEWSQFGNEQSTVRGIEILTEFTDRYPDDVEGWYQLGDAYYHTAVPGWPYIPRERTDQVLRRAVELDPSFGPAYIHLFSDALAREDTVEARRLVAGLRQIDSTSAQVIGSALTYALRLGNSTERAGAAAALDTLGREELRWAIGFPLGMLGPTSPRQWKEDLQVAQLLAEPRHSPEQSQRRLAQFAISRIYYGRGRRREAAEMLAPILGSLDPFWSYFVATTALADLRATTDSVTAQAARRLTREPTADDHFVLGALAAREQRWNDVESELSALEADVRAASPPDSNTGARAHALIGYAAAVRGERQAAIGAFDEAYRWVTGPTALLVRVLLGKLWLEEGNFAQAERYFESMELVAASYDAPIEFYLGKVYEGLGKFDEARLHYARFVSWWEDCDPELRPMWAEGKQALERLRRMERM